MSIAFYLLLALLWLSFHACDARTFGVLRNNETSQEFHHSITKENEKSNPARVSIKPERRASIQNDAGRGIAKEESSRFEKEEVNREPNHMPRTRIDQVKGDRVKVSGTYKKSESVAWRVPHKKGGEPEAGFNLDYLPPKTHPPVHN